METLIGKTWHHIPQSEVILLLSSDSEKGLDRFEIKHRQQHFGLNAIPTEPGQSAFIRFLHQFKNPLIIILLLASLITFMIKDGTDAIIIFAIVLINAFIGFFQESKAEQAIKALAGTINTEATVIRSGEQTRISATELIPGDIVLFQAGDKIPADLRLLYTRDLQIAEAPLTGESLPVLKDAQVELDVNTVVSDRINMAYASTLVTAGQGKGIVVATGSQTEIGRISQLIRSTIEIETPLTKKMGQFSRFLMVAILGLAAIIFFIDILRGKPLFDTLYAAIALSVAMIPEGLPAALTITLAIGVTRMAKRRAIIRKLPAVETLGSVTVICSDKTGTLTQNQMTVTEIYAGEETFDVGGIGYSPQGSITKDANPVSPSENQSLYECLIAGMICNEGSVLQEEGQWLANGDPTEAALIISALKAGFPHNFQQNIKRYDQIPFDSRHKYSAVLVPTEKLNQLIGRTNKNQEENIIYIKGAPEAILPKCNTQMTKDGQLIPLNPKDIQDHLDRLAKKGLRILAFAYGTTPINETTLDEKRVEHGLTFLGFQAMMDPPREEAIKAIQTCQQAGIKVKMITGDHALTAGTIATMIGIAQPCDDGSPPSDCVLTGFEIQNMSDDQLIHYANHTPVFARVTPEQKLRLVEALQAKGNIVAMTGDGVNDGPALKQADIGVAMGITGSEVAKEAADMILTDDNFASIEVAVEEGRGVFDNLTKIITWTLPTNFGEGAIILVAVLLGITLPILPVHILWINTVTAAMLGLVLAFEVKEMDIMQRPPRNPKAPILSNNLLYRILMVSLIILVGAFGLYEVHIQAGAPIAQARTLAVNAVIMVQLFYLLNCRSLTRSFWQVGVTTNPWVYIGVGGMITLQLLFTYLPFMNKIFSSAPISPLMWLQAIAVGVLGYIIIEIEKLIARRRN